MTRKDSLHVAVALHRAAIRLLRTVRAADLETGLSAAKLSALSVLAFGGVQSLSMLARAEQVTTATMSKLVSDLVAEGLVAKRADRQDKRAVRIEVTGRGRALMEEGRRRRLALLAERMRALSCAERVLLADAAALMDRIASAS